jgi:hypothetical protein
MFYHYVAPFKIGSFHETGARTGALVSCACRRPLPVALRYQIYKKYYMKTGITGVGTRDAGDK